MAELLTTHHRFRRQIAISCFIAAFICLSASNSFASGCREGTFSAQDCQYEPVSNSVAPPPQVSNGVRLNPGTNVLFNNFGQLCRFVDNTSTNSYFIPQSNFSEFSSFLQSNAVGIVKGNCVFPTAYTAQASLPAASIELDQPSGQLVNAGPAVAGVTMPVPTQTAYSGVVRTDVGGPALSTSISPQFNYIRYDCRIDDAGTKVCNTRNLQENQQVTFTTPDNPAPGSDHYWGNPQVLAGFKLDGVTVTNPNDNYMPPGLQSCTISGITYPSGTTWSTNSSANQSPTSDECPLGAGTRIDQVSTATSYLCTDGKTAVQGTPVSTVTGYTGSCVTSNANCTVTLFGVQCATGQAQVEFYKLTPTNDRSGYNGLTLPGGINNLTSADRLPNLVLQTNQMNIPLQNFSIGFPGYSYLTTWFGACYDGGYLVQTEGDYSFEVDADDGAVLWIDGTNFTEGGDWTVYNDNINGNHPNGQGGYQPAYGTKHLTPGLHDIVVKYYQGWPTELGLQVYVTPPGGRKQIMQITQAPNGVLNCPL